MTFCHVLFCFLIVYLFLDKNYSRVRKDLIKSLLEECYDLERSVLVPRRKVNKFIKNVECHLKNLKEEYSYYAKNNQYFHKRKTLLIFTLSENVKDCSIMYVYTLSVINN